MAESEILVPRVWRSQASLLILFIISSPLCIWLSARFPQTIIKGPLFIFEESILVLKLPLLWLIPAYFVFKALVNVYDVRYSLDNRGIESKIGILSLSQTITRVRYEDIRSVDSRQTLIERILGIGTLELGTAASAGLEIIFTGIDRPTELQKQIQNERDRRLRKAAARNDHHEKSNLAAAGGE